MITTDINFPDGLPCPLLSSNQTNHVQPFLRTNMESGRARQRRRFTSVPSISEYSWVFTSNEAAAFEIWFKDSAMDGAAWFNIHRPTPLGDSILVCRFTRMYQGPNSLGNGLWGVTAEMEAWERPLLPDGWGLLPDFVIYASIFDIAMNREWPEAEVGPEALMLTETGAMMIVESLSPVTTPEAVKISSLPAAQPLTGAEYIPVVQSGVTRRSTMQAVSSAVGNNTDYNLYYDLAKD